MADTATPPTALGNATTGDVADKSRPTKPDEAKFKADEAKALKDHELQKQQLNAYNAKFETSRTNKDSPGNDRWNALIAEQKTIREQQSANKGARNAQQEKYNAAENQIKALIAEQKNARSRMPYKNVEEIDAQIDNLTKQVDSGRMKLVDEKKALAEVSSLRKQRKGFSGLDDIQKRIDAKKAENAELRKTFDTQESRALSQKYEDNQKEIDEIKAGREENRKNVDSIKAERDKLRNEERAAYAKVKEIRDAYHQNRIAYKEYEDMIFQQRRERQKAERDAYESEKRKRRAEQTLEEASNKAYMDEIRLTQSLLAHFDPSTRIADTSKDESKFAATAQRTVDESGPKGMKVMKKEEEDFFAPAAGKKKGRGKKSVSAAEGGKYNLDFGTIEGLGKLGVEPPTSQAEVPMVVEKLKEKLDFYKKDQDRQTKANIETAQKEIERLEKEAAEPSPSSSAPKTDGRRRDGRAKRVPAKDAGVNGNVSAEAELVQEKDASADVAEDMKKASIEDDEEKENAAVEA